MSKEKGKPGEKQVRKVTGPHGGTSRMIAELPELLEHERNL
jgi:hypothetical protein